MTPPKTPPKTPPPIPSKPFSEKGVFSVEPSQLIEGADVPSITKLLNRKKLASPKAASPLAGETSPETSPSPAPLSLTPKPEKIETQPTQQEPNPSPPPPPSGGGLEIELSSTDESSFAIETRPSPSEPLEISIEADAPVILSEEVAALNSSDSLQPNIRPRVPRKAASPPQKLIHWPLSTLEKSPDPLGRGIHLLLKKGAKQALYLSIQAPASGSSIPTFLSMAGIEADQKADLWTGLRWDPTVVPDSWNTLVQLGSVELPPPGTRTDIQSNRNVIRAAFGIPASEWILLVRCGPANGCRGIVAFVSAQSLLPILPEALPLLSSPAPR